MAGATYRHDAPERRGEHGRRGDARGGDGLRPGARSWIIGGKKLGMVGGQFLDFSPRVRPHNDMWMTVAQALLRTSDPLAALSSEAFTKTGVAPIAGLWSL